MAHSCTCLFGWRVGEHHSILRWQGVFGECEKTRWEIWGRPARNPLRARGRSRGCCDGGDLEPGRMVSKAHWRRAWAERFVPASPWPTMLVVFSSIMCWTSTWMHLAQCRVASWQLPENLRYVGGNLRGQHGLELGPCLLPHSFRPSGYKGSARVPTEVLKRKMVENTTLAIWCMRALTTYATIINQRRSRTTWTL